MITFHETAQFLTLDTNKYPLFAHVAKTVFVPSEGYFAAQFQKKIGLPAHGGVAKIAIFADTKFRLSINGQYIGMGPIATGGDYENREGMPKQYYNEYEIPFEEDYFDVLAEVQTPGTVMTEYSLGRGCLIFSAEIVQDDKTTLFVSDETWEARQDIRYDTIARVDFTRDLPAWEPVVVIPKEEAPWNLTYADLLPLAEDIIRPVAVYENETPQAKGQHCVRFDFPRIYAAYVLLEIDNTGDTPEQLDIYAAEYLPSPIKELISPVEYITVPVGKMTYRGLRMWSTGEVAVICSDKVQVRASIAYVRYPTDEEKSGTFVCSDEKLTGIYNLGRSTLEMCRQTIHLDSPLHQETLCCTGDYAIEMLMTTTTFGDMKLSRMDLIRTSDYLKMSNGHMFHTSYSLIFVTMLRDYYLYTGDTALVKKLLPTVEVLLKRFDTYIENGVISNPPNYMFIEWGELDGYSLHHPPKALGQTSLNAFYQLMLCAAAELYAYSGNKARSDELSALSAAHKAACVDAFYDKEKAMFTDGMTAEESTYEPNEWLPENATRHYYTRHANILAVLAGFLEDERAASLLTHIIEEPSAFEEFDIQPYFMHYFIEAVRKYGLFAKYGLELLHWWDKQLADSPKGMKEGWGLFCGDNSHAWGATPTYQLPVTLAGFEMLEAGYKKFQLTPCLYGIAFADITLPTPYGLVSICLQAGEKPVVHVPTAYALIENVLDGEVTFVVTEK